jgi:manganese/zinc/iron transport system substrate-binding protein
MNMLRIRFKYRNRLFSATVAALAAAALAAGSACERASDATARESSGPQGAAKAPYVIVTTTGMVADIVRSVAGDRAKVRALMGAGVDPHLYRATRDDVSALLAADMVFYNGLNLEGKMSDVFIRIARSGKPVHAVTELLPEEFLLAPPDFQGHDDPHVWMDPGGWIKAAEAVIAKLSEFDSAGADVYRRNGEAYIAEMKRVDEYARQRLATIPAERRVLVTAHDAFNYFARAYGVQVRGIQGISTDSEAGLQQIESLVKMLVERRIPAVFTESSVSEKNISALVEGAKARGHDIRIGGELFSDAMGADATYEGTYVGMIDHNITTIVHALGGDAPQRGMNGRLSHK